MTDGCRYIMNYLDRNNIAAARLAGLQDELKLSSEQFQVRTPKIPEALVSANQWHPDIGLNLICGICVDADSLKSLLGQNWETFTIFAMLHDYLGLHFRRHRGRPELRWIDRLSIRSRIHRSCLLPWLPVLSVILVHA